MALTAIEQIKIIRGDVSPTESSLRELVQQTAFVFARQFYDTYKDTSGNADAEFYKEKIFQAINRLMRGDIDILDSLVRLIITIYGITGSYATVEGASDSQWETFILNNIEKAIELQSGVLQNEKSAYDSLP